MTQPATFRRHERLTDARDFQRVFDRRRSASDGKIVVHAAENGLDYPRLGLSVGRKKIRRAHDRNHFKRLVREAFRLSKAELPVGFDFVVSPKGSAKLNFQETRQTLPALAQSIARRIGVRPIKAPS